MSNKNPIGSKLVIGLLVGVVAIVFFAKKNNGVDVEAQMNAEDENSPTMPVGESGSDADYDLGTEGDTSNDTIRTLVAQIAGIQTQLTEKEKVIEQQSIPVVENNNQPNEYTKALMSKYEKLIAKVADLEGNVGEFSDKNQSQDPFTRLNEYPINSGNKNPNIGKGKKYLENNGSNSQLPQLNRPHASVNNPVNFANDEIIWIEPLDSEKTMNKDGTFEFSVPDISISSFKETELYGRLADSDYGKSIGADKEVPVIPFATIGRGGISIDAVTLTALIGRIPIGGQVYDPFKFKALISGENLASNGILIDGLQGATIGGRVSGDYALSCVKGEIDYITFTFDDGTISSFPETKGGEESGEQSLGYISDNAGIPCVSGSFLTNGGTYLAQQAAITALSVGAKSYASAQTTSQVNGDSTNSTVTGDDTKYALGEMGAAGIQTTSDWLAERNQSAFDAVYAPPSTRITVHFETEIPINYDPQGRRTNYEQFNPNFHNEYDFTGLN